MERAGDRAADREEAPPGAEVHGRVAAHGHCRAQGGGQPVRGRSRGREDGRRSDDAVPRDACGRLRGSRILLLPLVTGSNYHHGMLARTNIAEFLTRLPFDYCRVLVMARLLYQLIVMRLNLQRLLLRRR